MTDLFERWSDGCLDAARQVGDPVADEVIERLFRNRGVGATNSLWSTLKGNDDMPDQRFPDVVAEYLDATDNLPPWAEPHLIEAGEVFFQARGAECVLSLLTSGLPNCYAAWRGARVLMATQELARNPGHRVVETAQMVLHVMQRGGLAAQGQGVRTIQKVRLMHAAVRHHLVERGDWDKNTFGVPVCQEDMALTMLAFSVVPILAMRKLNLENRPEDELAYFHAWMVVGYLTGVPDALIPRTVDDGIALWRRIEERQLGPSNHPAADPGSGRALTTGLFDLLCELIPGQMLDATPVGFAHMFLGTERSEWLGLPEAPVSTRLAEALAQFNRFGDESTGPLALMRGLFNWLALQLIEGLVNYHRPGDKVPFQIPLSLRSAWDNQNPLPG